ncbi:hypothetical protein APHAL10511_004828 [Amanita phalloides]|nr:hypothetical protein APHAL10511_004828 [Amanita phalloides]
MVRPRIVKALRLFWTFVVIWFEYGTFWFAVNRCSWPDFRLQTSSPSATRPTHVLVIADPQILDHRSYPGRLAILNYVSRVMVDLNLRKSWRAATRLRPDAVVFLGDMMDGGRFPMPDTEYESYYKRFKAIFALDRTVPEYFIPGNHDTGLKMSASESKQARERYVSHFGPLNQQQHQVSFAEWRRSPEGTVKFVERLAGAIQPPIILLSHIPLYRPAGSDCGPLRERGTIHQGYGNGYQNILEQDATNFLLQTLRPSLILSGDDHDYCEFNHTIDRSEVAREVTVKSLSIAMNVKRPGFQLLSLSPKLFRKNHATTHADELCLLPDQISIYLSIYLPLLFISLLVVLLLNAESVRNRSIFDGLEMTSLSYSERNAMLSLRSTSVREDSEEDISILAIMVIIPSWSTTSDIDPRIQVTGKIDHYTVVQLPGHAQREA